jgi:hypothetical protein
MTGTEGFAPIRRIRVFDKFPRDVLVNDTFTVTAIALADRIVKPCTTIFKLQGTRRFVPGDTALLKVGKK